SRRQSVAGNASRVWPLEQERADGLRYDGVRAARAIAALSRDAGQTGSRDVRTSARRVVTGGDRARPRAFAYGRSGASGSDDPGRFAFKPAGPVLGSDGFGRRFSPRLRPGG